MCDYQTLRSCWVDFLSETYFDSKEFKYIKAKFFTSYPEFRSKWLYQKTYQAFRDAQADGLMSVDISSYPYKYTSSCIHTGARDEVANIVPSECIKKQLYEECVRLQNEVKKINFEIEILSKYMKLYPAINQKIACFISDHSMNLQTLHSEISVLDKLINDV